jgi:hypothetical protein
MQQQEQQPGSQSGMMHHALAEALRSQVVRLLVCRIDDDSDRGALAGDGQGVLRPVSAPQPRRASHTAPAAQVGAAEQARDQNTGIDECASAEAPGSEGESTGSVGYEHQHAAGKRGKNVGLAFPDVHTPAGVTAAASALLSARESSSRPGSIRSVSALTNGGRESFSAAFDGALAASGSASVGGASRVTAQESKRRGSAASTLTHPLPLPQVLFESRIDLRSDLQFVAVNPFQLLEAAAQGGRGAGGAASSGSSVFDSSVLAACYGVAFGSSNGTGADSSGSSILAAYDWTAERNRSVAALVARLESLPPNTCLVALADGYYMLQSQAQSIGIQPPLAPLPLPSPAMQTAAAGNGYGTGNAYSALSALAAAGALNYSLPPPSAAAASHPHTEKHSIALHFESMLKLLDTAAAMEGVREQIESSLADIQTATAKALQGPARSEALEDVVSDSLSDAAEIAQLEMAVAEMAKEQDLLRKRNDARKFALQTRVMAVKKGMQEVGAAAATLPIMQREVDATEEEVLLLNQLTTARRFTLLADLKSLYPITAQAIGPKSNTADLAALTAMGPVPSNLRYSIRGIALPDRERDMLVLPEEQVSTALGHTCHLLLLAAKYLGVPLRYTPSPQASRSTMRDAVLANTVEYPLYWKGVQQEDFFLGVLMLRRSVSQLVQTVGLAPLPAASATGASSTGASAAGAAAATGGGSVLGPKGLPTPPAYHQQLASGDISILGNLARLFQILALDIPLI